MSPHLPTRYTSFPHPPYFSRRIHDSLSLQLALPSLVTFYTSRVSQFSPRTPGTFPTLHFALVTPRFSAHASHLSPTTSRSALSTPHFALIASHFAQLLLFILPASPTLHFTRFALSTSHSALLTFRSPSPPPCFALLTSHFSPRASQVSHFPCLMLLTSHVSHAPGIPLPQLSPFTLLPFHTSHFRIPTPPSAPPPSHFSLTTIPHLPLTTYHFTLLTSHNSHFSYLAPRTRLTPLTSLFFHFSRISFFAIS